MRDAMSSRQTEAMHGSHLSHTAEFVSMRQCCAASRSVQAWPYMHPYGLETANQRAAGVAVWGAAGDNQQRQPGMSALCVQPAACQRLAASRIVKPLIRTICKDFLWARWRLGYHRGPHSGLCRDAASNLWTHGMRAVQCRRPDEPCSTGAPSMR